MLFFWGGGGYHNDAAENGYVVTAQNSRKIRDVTNGGVTKRSEMAKLRSRRTLVKLTAAYVRLVTCS